MNSIRLDSFFANSKLSFEVILKIIYYYSYKNLQINAIRDIQIANSTAVNFYNFLRQECGEYILAHPSRIGGIDGNGDRIIVEIDESLFFKPKYHVGAWRGGQHWVFGGVERGTGNCFLTVVADRTAATLEAEIQQYIAPGTHIMSDGWASYANIDQIPNMNYVHDVVVHARNFVNPQNPLVHTQSVESMWCHAKRQLKHQYGTSNELFDSYLFDHMFRYKNRDQKHKFFEVVLILLQQNYPV